MKVKIGPYASRWRSSVHENYMETKYGDRFLDSSESFDFYVEALDGMIDWVYDHTINLYLDNKEQSVKVDIHKYDTWSMDTTLAHIVVPMLKQLKATTHGYPSSLTEEEWNNILDDMIFAFESKNNNWEEQFYSGDIENDTFKVDSEGREEYQSRITKGFELFGKYYEGLWD